MFHKCFIFYIYNLKVDLLTSGCQYIYIFFFFSEKKKLCSHTVLNELKCFIRKYRCELSVVKKCV